MLTFETEQDAIEWMHGEIDYDPYMDNIRIGYMDDDHSRTEYDWIHRRGCCGFFDSEHVLIGGRVGFIGCNYGH